MLPHLPEHNYLARDTYIAHNQRKTMAVIILTVVTMGAEIGVGHVTRSMALLADGWHMATHAGALAISYAAYFLARSSRMSRRFSFGAGKFLPLGGYTNALILAVVAFVMVGESIGRLLSPEPIAYREAIAVAVLGLVVNIVSFVILGHEHHDEHGEAHGHGHGHGHRHGHASHGGHGDHGHDHQHGHEAHGHGHEHGHGHASHRGHEVHGHHHQHGHEHLHGHEADGHGHEHGHGHASPRAHGLPPEPRPGHGHWHEPHGARDEGLFADDLPQDPLDDAYRAPAAAGKGHKRGHRHDTNFHSVYLHVLADAFTSILAIAALLLGKYFGWVRLDPAIAILGALVILQWSVTLARDAGFELLDGHAKGVDQKALVALLERHGAVVVDLHIWQVAPHAVSCMLTLTSAQARGPAFYHALINRHFRFVHVTVEENVSAVRLPRARFRRHGSESQSKPSIS